VRHLESFGVALIVVAALLGVVLALGLYRWEANTRAALALANPSSTPTTAPQGPTPTIALSNQPAGIPTPAVTDTPVPTPTLSPSPTAASVTPSPAASPVAGSPTPGTSPTAISAPTATAPPAVTPSPTSIGDPAAGAKAFATSCNQGHPNANAGVGPALHGPQFTSRFPDNTALKALIRAGRAPMPAFPASALSEANLNNIVAYLRSLK